VLDWVRQGAKGRQTNPQPEISLYLKTPNPISIKPIMIIIKGAHPKTVFLFIAITEIYFLEDYKYR
jgi:hypothetical protein